MTVEDGGGEAHANQEMGEEAICCEVADLIIIFYRVCFILLHMYFYACLLRRYSTLKTIKICDERIQMWFPYSGKLE